MNSEVKFNSLMAKVALKESRIRFLNPVQKDFAIYLFKMAGKYRMKAIDSINVKRKEEQLDLFN